MLLKQVSAVYNLTTELANTLAGVTNAQLDARVLQFEIFKIEQRNKLLEFAWSTLPPEEVHGISYHACAMFFAELYNSLHDACEQAIHCYCSSVVDEIEMDEAAELVKPTISVLYYIASWLLRSLAKQFGTFDTTVRHSFVRHNSIARDEAKVVFKQTAETVEKREICQGSLTCSNIAWFRFVFVLESLYIVNLTPENILRHGSELFPTILDALSGSTMLQDLFSACFPSSFDQDMRLRIWRRYFPFILPSYNKMRARDFMRTIRARNNPGEVEANKGPLRLQVAHVSSKTSS
jgi:hypothetical protein